MKQHGLEEHDRKLQMYLSCETIGNTVFNDKTEEVNTYMLPTFEQLDQRFIDASLNLTLSECQGLVKYFQAVKKNNEDLKG